jgi:hypothetical protein
MAFLYPAKSEERLHVVCEKLAIVFGLPPFQTTFRSEYFEKAQSAGGTFFGFIDITVIEYFGSVNSEQVKQIDPPYYWDLAWRAAVGLQFNYQVAIYRGLMKRNHKRRIARKLRSVFTEIRLHGEPVAA